MAAPFTAQQLMTPATFAELRAKFLAILQAHGFPAITEWALPVEGTEINFVNMVVQAVNDRLHSGSAEEKRLAAIAASRLMRFSQGDWTRILAKEFYDLDWLGATYTTFDMILTAVATAPAYTYDAGDVWLVGPTGKRYQSTTAGSLSPGSELPMSFKAEAVGSEYSDDPQVVALALATAAAGVSLKVGGGDFTPVAQQGASTGRIIPFRTSSSSAPLAHTFAIRIDSAGEPGVATFSLQIDAGVFVPQGFLSASGNGLAGGTSIKAIAGLAPSFQLGDVFTFSTPGTPNYVQGNDDESNDSLIDRSRSRWPTLSDNILDAKVKLWVRQAYPSANRIQISPDLIVPGRFIVSVADSHGAVDQAVLNVIVAYIAPKLNEGEGVSAQSASTLPIVTAGNVKVKGVTAEQLEAMQNTAQSEWVKHLASIDMGGEVKLAVLEDIIMDTGALDVGDVTPITLNGSAANIQLAPGQVPTDGNPAGLAAALTWMQA